MNVSIISSAHAWGVSLLQAAVDGSVYLRYSRNKYHVKKRSLNIMGKHIQCLYFECMRMYLEYYNVLVRLESILVYLEYIASMQNDGPESPSGARKKG